MQLFGGWRFARLTWSTEAESTFFYDARELRPVPARVEHDVALRLSPNIAWRPTFTFEVDNVLDTRMQRVDLPNGGATTTVDQSVADYLGYPLPGRAFYATLTVRPHRWWGDDG